MAMKTWVSKTLWRWLMVLANWSFNVCILLLKSDSTTVSFDSWRIFFNFVVFCNFVWNVIKDAIMMLEYSIIMKCSLYEEISNFTFKIIKFAIYKYLLSIYSIVKPKRMSFRKFVINWFVPKYHDCSNALPTQVKYHNTINFLSKD